MEKNKQALGKLALLGTAIIWGTSFVVLKNTLNSVGPMWILAIRFSVSALLLFAIAGKKIFKVSRRCLRGSMILGLCLAIAYALQTVGLIYTTPGKNAFLTATYCVSTPFMAWLVYKRKPGISNVIAGVLCISGIGFVSLSDGLTSINRGDILTLISGIFYAMQIIAMEQYHDSGDALSISVIQFATAAVLLLIGALIFEQPPVDVPGSAWLSIGYLSVMCTAVCFFLQAWGMQYTSSSTAAMLMTLECIFGVLLSVLLYGEIVTGKMLLGFVLIFFAVIFAEINPLDFLKRKRA